MRGERLSVLMGSVPHTTKIFSQSHDPSHMIWLAQPHSTRGSHGRGEFGARGHESEDRFAVRHSKMEMVLDGLSPSILKPRSWVVIHERKLTCRDEVKR